MGMRAPRMLTCGLAAAVFAAAGCSRSEADRSAREAAVEVRNVADQAGERLSDGWLTTKIQAQYFADRDIKARYLDVTTRDGVVTVSGFVENLAARDEAIQIARNTDGVREVNDQLKIGVAPSDEAFTALPQGTEGAVATGGAANEYEHAVNANAARAAATDDQVLSSVQARFYLDPAIKRRDISVTAQNGVVTLQGTVADETERAKALTIARNTEGVGRVEDMLTIDAAVK